MNRKYTTEAFYAVQTAHQSGNLTALQWQAYQMLWHHGPMSAKDLNLKAQEAFGHCNRPLWGAQAKKLQKLGLAEPVDKQWDVTDRETLLVPPAPPKKPSKGKYAKGVEDIEMALVKAEVSGLNSEAAQAVLIWLKGKL